MNKAEIINAVAAATGKTIAVSAEVINAFLLEIQNEVAKGGRVELKNFAVFDVIEVAEHKGRNPQTNEAMIIPAYKRPHFSPSRVFKELVNGKRALPETKKAPAVAEAVNG